MKGVNILWLYGNSDKENMVMALQNYQALAVMWGVEAIQKVQLGTDEVKETIQRIEQSLAMLATSPINVKTEVNTMRTNIAGLQESINESVTLAKCTNAGVETANAIIESLKTFSKDILQELKSLRNHSMQPVLSSLNRPSDMDRAQMEIQFDTTNEYLQKLRDSGGYLSDLELWELVWDFTEIYRELGGIAVALLEKGDTNLVYVNFR